MFINYLFCDRVRNIWTPSGNLPLTYGSVEEM